MAARAEELEEVVQQLQKECGQAVTAASGFVGRPSTPRGSPTTSSEVSEAPNVADIVSQLVDKLKVCLA